MIFSVGRSPHSDRQKISRKIEFLKENAALLIRRVFEPHHFGWLHDISTLHD